MAPPAFDEFACTRARRYSTPAEIIITRSLHFAIIAVISPSLSWNYCSIKLEEKEKDKLEIAIKMETRRGWSFLSFFLFKSRTKVSVIKSSSILDFEGMHEERERERGERED